MKIILTPGEVKNIVSKHFNISAISFDLEVTEVVDPTIIDALQKAKTTAGQSKISAIKDLRKTHYGYGLWEAKTVVENIDQAIRVATNTKSWPVPVWGSGYDTFVWKK